jgi:GAF domain-containing protein
MLPDDWRRHAPDLCDGVEADYLLVDLGPSCDHPRYTILGLSPGAFTLHLVERLSEVNAPASEGGLGVQSSLFVPLYRRDRRHHGHVAALYRGPRTFDSGDVERLQNVARRFLTFLTAR